MTITSSLAELTELANQFELSAPAQSVEPYGSGNINDTYLVKTEPTAPQYLLQRINQAVFPRPDWIMENLATLQQHMELKMLTEESERQWVMPAVVKTPAGRDHLYDSRNEFWRLQLFVEGSQSFAEVRDSHHAAEAGFAVARFHRLIADLSTERLHDTLPGFHITPQYLSDYKRHKARWPEQKPSNEEKFCFEFIAEREHKVGLLEDAQAKGTLLMRPIHGDPKVDNILIDTATDRAISVIDLDTAKPGLVHYDIGDMIRSGCNPLGEREPDWRSVRFESELCQAILQAYCREATFLTAADFAYIQDSIWLMAFEMGLRFFSDYLNNNVYFNAPPEVNLLRALVQFQLTSSIEAQQQELAKIVTSLH